MNILHKVEYCNKRDMRRFVPFTVAGVQYGWLTHERAAVVLAHPSVFRRARGAVTFRSLLDTPAQRSRAIAEIAAELAATGHFPHPRGELYAVKNRWSERPAFRIDRALNPGFGLRAYGVHVNGVVLRKPGSRDNTGPRLWIATRAKGLQVEPGKLDNMVAGGLTADLGVMENLVKECAEEAHLAPRLARTARSASVIHYGFESPQGLRADTLFCYDLAMPATTIPRPSEEVSRYDLMPLAKALKIVRTTRRFKFNVNLVIIDFAIRQGLITPENEPDFERIVAGLHERPSAVVP
ncbi:MAG: DUF4743 domain-containing protein [Rhodospirillaceae bacterium]|nr:DUF4743 domain-containing protein [Rhodospirillaceae bacterium]